MLTGTKLKQIVELYTGADISADDMVAIINEALVALGDFALHYEEVNINIPENEEGKWISLPADTTAIIKVVNSDTLDTVTDWEFLITKIKFGTPGNYTVTIRTMVPRIFELSDVIQVHPIFKHALICYVIGFIKLMDDDSSPDGLTHMNRFYEEVGKSHTTLKEMRNVN